MTDTVDNTYFRYTVKDFDAERKIVHVVFEDGAWAKIPLVAPLPQNRKDLDVIVRTFTAPKEHLDAMAEPIENLNFIAELVGTQVEAERFSFYKAAGRHKVDKLIAEREAADATRDDRIAAAIAADKQVTETTPEKE